MDLVKFIVFLDQAIKKWVAKVDATHHTSRIALQIWSDGGADPLEAVGHEVRSGMSVPGTQPKSPRGNLGT